jgi:hypothetical protein
MLFKRKAGWLAAICATVGTAVLLAASPASANAEGYEGSWFGHWEDDSQFLFNVWSYDDIANNSLGYWATAEGDLYLGRNAVVSATDCKIVLWAELDKAGSNTWLSPKVTQSCMQTIRSRSSWYYYYTDGWATSGNVSRTHLCVYLYYGGSSSYGWSRCETGEWANAWVG